mgnify:CR=1 FL=1
MIEISSVKGLRQSLALRHTVDLIESRMDLAESRANLSESHVNLNENQVVNKVAAGVVVESSDFGNAP